MAYKGRNPMLKALGQMVGLLLALYVFNLIVEAVWAIVNNASSVFYDASTFVYSLFSVMGILAAFDIVYGALQKSGLM